MSRRRKLPPCAVSMSCLCAGHARGIKATDPCDTRELSHHVQFCVPGSPRAEQFIVMITGPKINTRAKYVTQYDLARRRITARHTR